MQNFSTLLAMWGNGWCLPAAPVQHGCALLRGRVWPMCFALSTLVNASGGTELYYYYTTVRDRAPPCATVTLTGQAPWTVPVCACSQPLLLPHTPARRACVWVNLLVLNEGSIRGQGSK